MASDVPIGSGACNYRGINGRATSGVFRNRNQPLSKPQPVSLHQSQSAPGYLVSGHE